jgi:hypothetical protein
MAFARPRTFASDPARQRTSDSDCTRPPLACPQGIGWIDHSLTSAPRHGLEVDRPGGVRGWTSLVSTSRSFAANAAGALFGDQWLAAKPPVRRGRSRGRHPAGARTPSPPRRASPPSPSSPIAGMTRTGVAPQRAGIRQEWQACKVPQSSRSCAEPSSSVGRPNCAGRGGLVSGSRRATGPGTSTSWLNFAMAGPYPAR